MQPPAVQPPTEEPSPHAGWSSTYGFAAALAILGAATVVAASVLPYARSAGEEGRLVEFDLAFRVWVWSAIHLWGTALIILVVAALLIPNRVHPMLLAGSLIALAVETVLLNGSTLGFLLVTDNVDPGPGTYLGIIAGLIVMSGGIVAYRTWTSARVST
jgi:hypothetical protein